MKRSITLGLVLAFALVVATDSLDAADVTTENALASSAAVCVIVPVGDHQVSGTLRFVQDGDTVHITGTVKGLSPGKHGFHVHEFGDVSGTKNGKSTGGHYNPEGTKHGKQSDKERHVGDLGNITADKNGVAKVDITDKVVTLCGPHSIIGRSILIHAKPDDYGQPTGNAGARVAFGVIGIAKPSES